MDQKNDLKKEDQNSEEARAALEKLLEFAKVINDNFSRKHPPKTDKTGAIVRRLIEEE